VWVMERNPAYWNEGPAIVNLTCKGLEVAKRHRQG
jgi:hypothetical protein